MTDKNTLKYELLLLLMSLLWGTTFVAQQIGMQKGIGPFSFNGLRFSLGLIALLPVLIWRRRFPRPDKVIEGLPVKGSLLAGLFMFSAVNFQQFGLQYTSSANAGFITGLYVVLVPLIGIFLGHKAPLSLWAGMVVCVAGLYLLSVKPDFTLGKGDGLILICAFLWAAQILTINNISRRGDSFKIAFLQYVVVAVLSLIAGVLLEDWSLLSIESGAGAVVYAGILSVGVAFTLQIICQKRCPPAPAAVIMSMEAVFAALAGYIVLSQEISLRSIFGCLLIFCGMLIVQLVPIMR